MSDPFPPRAADVAASGSRGGRQPSTRRAGRRVPGEEDVRRREGTGDAPGAVPLGDRSAHDGRGGPGNDPHDQDHHDQDHDHDHDHRAAGEQDGDRGGPRQEGEDAPRRRSSGRNLPAAIGVGLLLGLVVVGSLFVRREAFVILTTIAVVVAIWEIANAFRARRVRIPLVPSVVGAVGMLASAYFAGPDALFVSLALTSTAILWWRVFEGPDPIRDVTAGVFTAVYVPYLAGFAIVMLAEDDGPFRVMAFLIVAVASDVGGYAVGSVFGRHVLAPTVSPNKSWEGVAGSAALASVAGAASVALLLGQPWWWGVLLGLAVTAAATVGDLSESLLKRDLGIKDMGSLLPGHGGVMDRMDSLLPAAPVAYVVLAVLG